MPVDKHPIYVSAAVLSCVATALFAIASVGVSNDEKTIKAFPWGVGRFDGFYYGQCWFGLNGYVLEYQELAVSEHHHKYTDCSEEWCRSCEDVGNSASFSLFSALWISFASSVLYIIVVMGHELLFLRMAAICAAVSALCAMASATAFRTCYVRFVQFTVDSAGGTSVGQFGALGWLVLVGFVLLSLAVMISVVSLFLSQLIPDDHEESVFHPFHHEHLLQKEAKIWPEQGEVELQPRTRSNTVNNLEECAGQRKTPVTRRGCTAKGTYANTRMEVEDC